MESTFLLHKPVIYGSAVANGLFLFILLLHIIPAVIAPLSAVVAFKTRPGSQRHQRSGRYFAGSMVIVALSGIVLDIVRLCFYVEENHTKYAGYSMPATYPARLGFMFVGVCVLYLLRQVTPPRVFGRQPRARAVLGLPSWVIPSLLVGTGLALTAIITLRLNPWTGALWMIWTFTLIVLVMMNPPSLSLNQREADVARHRFGTSCLAAFSWWGAFQSFGPAVFILIQGDDPSTKPYVGHLPGPFSPTFLFFLIAWAPFFCVAAGLIRHFRKLRHSSIDEVPDQSPPV